MYYAIEVSLSPAKPMDSQSTTERSRTQRPEPEATAEVAPAENMPAPPGVVIAAAGGAMYAAKRRGANQTGQHRSPRSLDTLRQTKVTTAATDSSLRPPPGPALVSSSKDDLMQMVASRRYGRSALLDLRPIAAPYYPSECAPHRFDPTTLIDTLADAMAVAETLLSTSAVALSGTAFRAGTDPGPWDQLAFAPLTCLLYAAGRGGTGQGMEWTLAASENVAQPKPGRGVQLGEPSWAAAAAVTGDALFEARVRAVLDMEAKQRDSVKMTVTKVLTAWLRTSHRDRHLPPLDLSVFDEPGATVYLLTPADGTVAAQAITLMDALINSQRRKVAQWQDHHRVGMFLDEITNTPLPRLPQYLAESRGLGVAICYAAQAGSQLDAIYGPLQGRAIRDVTPAVLIMYGGKPTTPPQKCDWRFRVNTQGRACRHRPR
jgi:TraM recognition site of TraD and TraG